MLICKLSFTMKWIWKKVTTKYWLDYKGHKAMHLLKTLIFLAILKKNTKTYIKLNFEEIKV